MKERNENIFVIGLCLLAIAGAGYTICTQTFWFYDIEIYWRNTAGMFNGNTSGMTLLMPWARLLGQIICPGFLPYEVCLVYYYVLLLGGTIYLGFLIYKYQVKHNFLSNSRNRILASVSLCMLPFYWHDALNTGNAGGMVCVLLMIAAFFVDEHPYITAFLLAIAMTKPQNAGIFIAILFFRKNYKAVFSTAGICGISWLLSIAVLRLINGPSTSSSSSGRGIMEILTKYSNMGSDNEQFSFMSYGIFDPLVDFGVPTMVVLLMSVLFGLILALAFCIWVKKYPVLKEDAVIYFAFCSVLSILWCYKTPCDEIVMIMSSILAVYYWCLSDKKVVDILISLASLFAFNGKVFRFWGAHLINFSHDATILGDQILRLIFVIVLFVLVAKKLKSDKKVAEEK